MKDIINAFTIAFYEGHSSIMILLSKKLATLSNNDRKLLNELTQYSQQH